MTIPQPLKVTLIRGDTATISANLVRDGAPYIPPADSIIIFTAKRSPSDSDLDALFQKAIGTNLTLAGNVVTIPIFPLDTAFAESDKDGYYADIQVQEPDGTVTTAWLGKLLFTPDITRELTSSIVLYTVNPPVPGGPSTATPTYTFNQLIPALLWIVNHNLGVLVATTIFDLFGNEIEAEVANPSWNQTRILFSTPTAGKARCM